MSRYGFEHLKEMLVYVKTTKKVDQIKALKDEVIRLKELLTDEVLEHRIDQELIKILCRNAGITPEEAKK